jgi:hypothetical protein
VAVTQCNAQTSVGLSLSVRRLMTMSRAHNKQRVPHARYALFIMRSCHVGKGVPSDGG